MVCRDTCRTGELCGRKAEVSLTDYSPEQRLAEVQSARLSLELCLLSIPR